MKRIKSSLLLAGMLCLCMAASAQNAFYGGHFQAPGKGLKIHFNRFGPYIGVQRGKYTVLEFGVEKQFTKVKLIKPVTHAFHTGFNYNFKRNVLGYDLGYWCQVGRLNLTYGGNLVMRTDFSETRLGIAPVVGFKLFQFHLQTGYHFLTPARTFDETNRFFVSLRFVLVNSRKLDIDRNKPKKKKEEGGLFHRK